MISPCLKDALHGLMLLSSVGSTQAALMDDIAQHITVSILQYDVVVSHALAPLQNLLEADRSEEATNTALSCMHAIASIAVNV